MTDSRSNLIRLAASLSLVAVLIAAVAWSWQESARPASVARKAPSSFELSAEVTGEYSRIHTARSDGSRLRTDIVYHNGSKGVLLYRTDNTRSSFKVVTATGWTLTEAKFDASGLLVVEGFELRADRTNKWVTETLDTGLIKTVTYWRDGKQVFAQAVRSIAGDVSDTTYFHADGAIWAHQWKRTIASQVRMEEDLYGPDQQLARSIRWTAYVPEVKYYHKDGSLFFVHNFEVWSDEGGSSVLLSTATVYGDDGSKVGQVGFLFSHANRYTVYNADGSRVEHRYLYDGTPQAKIVVDIHGVETKYDDAADPNLLKQLPPAMLNTYIPTAQDLFAQWKEAEPK